MSECTITMHNTANFGCFLHYNARKVMKCAHAPNAEDGHRIFVQLRPMCTYEACKANILALLGFPPSAEDQMMVDCGGL